MRTKVNNLLSFYRAMHFSAKRGIAIACRLSVHLSVSLGVSVTLVNCDHRLEFFENNFIISSPGMFALCNPNMTGLLILLQGEHP